jgi:hypothetical protein
MIFVWYAPIRTIFISLIWNDEYGNNISTVEKYLKIFYFLFYFNYLSFFMKIVEIVDKKSKSPKHDDNSSLNNNFSNILY